MDEYEQGIVSYWLTTTNDGSGGNIILILGDKPTFKWMLYSPDKLEWRRILEGVGAEGWMIVKENSRIEQEPGITVETITIQLQRRLDPRDTP